MPVARHPNPLTPEQVAPRVLEGVREDLRYIFTHAYTKPQQEAHMQEMLDDWAAAEKIFERLG